MVFTDNISRAFAPDMFKRDAVPVHKKTISLLEKYNVPLLETGRYLPCLDDRPRVDISYSEYRLYRQLLEEIA